MNTPTACRSTTSTPAVLSLIFGLAGWTALPLVGALVAVVCGHLARAGIRQNPRHAVEGDGLAVAGLVLGYAQLALAAAGLVLLVLVVLGLSLAARP